MSAPSRTLLARQRARERRVEIGGHAYTVRRPRAAEMANDMTHFELARRFVCDWDLKQSDLIPGGGPDPEPFESALWADWLEDEPDLWQPLSAAILELWREYVAAREDAAKN